MTGAKKPTRKLVARIMSSGFIAPGADMEDVPYYEWILEKLETAADKRVHPDPAIRKKGQAVLEQFARIITDAQFRNANRELDARAPRAKKPAREEIIGRMRAFRAKTAQATLAQFVANEVSRGNFEDLGGSPKRFNVDMDNDYKLTESSLAGLWTQARRK